MLFGADIIAFEHYQNISSKYAGGSALPYPEIVAVKCIGKRVLKGKEGMLENEIAALRRLVSCLTNTKHFFFLYTRINHPNMVAMEETFQTSSKLSLVMTLILDTQ
uniref:Protein kinase domain-containing protein n=1 Tax=Oncorhynchus mykiss TaxID=8022 RepID=A0A8K9UWQ8_ONCMY